MTDTATFEAMVRSPGKFECEARYVPYYWAIGLDGFADDDDGTVFSFRITPEDRVLFPELRRRRVIRLMETNNGFVVEV
uniref:Uncharacterized protein n=1 Tax=viral metagenome TaxID=1070528 RepID=A0A6M3JYZ0_9ZZZZ